MWTATVRLRTAAVHQPFRDLGLGCGRPARTGLAHCLRPFASDAGRAGESGRLTCAGRPSTRTSALRERAPDGLRLDPLAKLSHPWQDFICENHISLSDMILPLSETVLLTGGAVHMQPVLEARQLVKHYGHVEALRGVDFTAYPGEVVALIGDNGAGKSTFVRIISGNTQPDSGEILMDGEVTTISSPLVARAKGVETVYQDLSLALPLDTPANLFLGRELRRSGVLGRLGFMDKKAMFAATKQVYERFGVDMKNATMPVGSLSGGQRQSVAVARAVAWTSKLVVLDEPTAALGVAQTRSVLALVKRIRDDGRAVVLISHSMEQVLDVADRIEVLRQDVALPSSTLPLPPSTT